MKKAIAGVFIVAILSMAYFFVCSEKSEANEEKNKEPGKKILVCSMKASLSGKNYNYMVKSDGSNFEITVEGKAGKQTATGENPFIKKEEGRFTFSANYPKNPVVSIDDSRYDWPLIISIDSPSKDNRKGTNVKIGNKSITRHKFDKRRYEYIYKKTISDHSVSITMQSKNEKDPPSLFRSAINSFELKEVTVK